jgi:iron uptake system component EfeO
VNNGRLLSRAAVLVAAAAIAAATAVACSGAPASTAGATGEAVVVKVVMTNAGCTPDRASVASGPVAIQYANEGADKVSELELMEGDRIVAERENLTPGMSGTISLVLDPGSYDLYCPGAATERTPFEVTAASS